MKAICVPGHMMWHDVQEADEIMSDDSIYKQKYAENTVCRQVLSC